jgi:hypothetical protein
MDKITAVHVRLALEQLQRHLPTQKLELDNHNPDGSARHYHLMIDGYTPFGSNCWIGAREAYNSLWLIINTIHFYERIHENASNSAQKGIK